VIRALAIILIANSAAADDFGGSVVAYALQARETTEARIEGICASACTLFLSVEDLCVGPSARFLFHAAYGAAPDMNEWATEYLLRSYPEWVREWIASEGGLSETILELPPELIRQHLKEC
jgi:hypothetical protein